MYNNSIRKNHCILFMKKYNQSILALLPSLLLILIYLPLTISSSFNEDRSSEIRTFILSIFLIFVIPIFYVTATAKILIQSNYLITKSKFNKQNIDISTINFIKVIKMPLFNKNKLQIQTGRYFRTDIYPRQEDMDELINDIIKINPNIIVEKLNK